MAKHNIVLVVDISQLRKIYNQALADAFLCLYDDFDNLESILDVRGITYEGEEL